MIIVLLLQDEVNEDIVEEVPPYDNDVYEDVEMGGSGEDDDDEPSQVYASVSAEHVAKKRYRQHTRLLLALDVLMLVV